MRNKSSYLPGPYGSIDDQASILPDNANGCILWLKKVEGISDDELSEYGLRKGALHHPALVLRYSRSQPEKVTICLVSLAHPTPED